MGVVHQELPQVDLIIRGADVNLVNLAVALIQLPMLWGKISRDVRAKPFQLVVVPMVLP